MHPRNNKTMPELNGKIALFLIGFVVWTKLYLKRSAEKIRTLGCPPGSLGYWIFGESFALMQQPKTFFQDRIRQYGANFITHIMFSPVVFLGDVKSREMMFASEMDKKISVSWPDHFQTLMGKYSLTTVNGHRHLSMRKLYSQMLTSSNIKKYLPFVDQTVTAWLRAECSKESCSDDFGILAFSVLFGTVFGGIATEEELLAMKNDFTTYTNGYFCWVPVALGRWNCMGRAMSARARLVSMFEMLVARSTDLCSNQGLLGMMVSSNELSKDEIVDSLLFFCFAGHDTTAASLATLTSVIFSRENLRYLELLREEVDALFPKNVPLDYEKLKTAPYLNACLWESWRYRSPALFGVRQADENLYLPDGTVVPKGVRVGYSQTAAHHADEYWGGAQEEFIPDRMTQRMDKDDFRKHHLNFGRGLRVCPGENLAKLELRVYLVRAVQMFDVFVSETKEVASPLSVVWSRFQIQPRVQDTHTF